MSLIAWYPLNGDTKDYSGSKNDATNTNAVVDANGKVDKCYSFNGSSSYLSTTNILKQGSPFSISFWAKLNNTSNQCFFCTRTILGNGISVFALDGNKIRFDTGSASYQWTTDYVVPVNTWVHITLVKDATSKRLYINGNFHSLNNLSGTMESLSTALMFGASHVNGTNLANYLNGYINDMRIYDHALSEKEIYEISKAKILHYNFDDCQEPTVNVVPSNLTNFELIRPYTGNADTQWEQTNHSDSGLKVISPLGVNSVVYNVADDGWLMLDIPASSLEPGQKYTTSLYVYPNKDYTFRLRWSSGSISQFAPANQWTRLINTQTYNSDKRILLGYRDSDGAANTPVDFQVAYAMAQLEQKEYATPFVTGSRKGMIRDYSGYKNDSILSGDVGITFQASSNVSISDNTVTKTAATGAWDAGALSSQCFIDDCFVEWQLDYGGTGAGIGAEIIGFTSSHSTWSHTDINFSIYTHGDGNVRVYENGTNMGTVTTWNLSINNVFRIEVRSSKVYYYMNGTLLYTSTVAPTFPLYVDMSLHCHATPHKVTNIKTGYLPTAKIIPKWTSDSIIGSGGYNFKSSLASYICVPNSQCKVTDNITVSAWAYRDNWDESSSERIISCTETGGWSLGFNDTPGYLSFAMYANGSYQVPKISLKSLSSGWHYIVGTYDGRYQKLFVDGNLVDTTDRGSIYPIAYNATNGIFIGAEPNKGNVVPIGNYWEGYIDDVRIYATALSDADIKSLYNTKASLDNVGNLYVSNIIEKAGAQSITEKSQLLTNKISEVGITDRLVGWWKLDGNTKDYSGNKYDGNIIGTVTLDSGPKSLAYKFPIDASSHIQLPVKAFQNMSDFTISLWAYSTDLSKLNCIFHGTNTSDNTISIEWYSNKINLLAFNTVYYTFDTTFNNDQWYHIVFTRKGTNVYMYKDGVLVNTLACADTIINVTGYLLLGQEQDGVGTSFDVNQCLRGKLTDLRIYDKALTSEEVGILFDITAGSKAAKFTDKCTYISGQFKEV